MVDLPFFGCPGGGIIPHKSLLPIDDWPSNNRFHPNLTSKSDSPGRVLFCAPGIWSKSEKIIHFRWFFDFFHKIVINPYKSNPGTLHGERVRTLERRCEPNVTEIRRRSSSTVSYTHLTLPTIYSV